LDGDSAAHSGLCRFTVFCRIYANKYIMFSININIPYLEVACCWKAMANVSRLSASERKLTADTTIAHLYTRNKTSPLILMPAICPMWLWLRVAVMQLFYAFDMKLWDVINEMHKTWV
jgi:hypothetical protein